MLGQIALFAGNFAPKGWELCAGRLIPINQNVALFSLLGTTYGGDGEANFALPDLRSKAPVSGLNYIIAVQGDLPSSS
jgi:microcystin-dependent protein